MSLASSSEPTMTKEVDVSIPTSQAVSYAVQLVLCIDQTGSMGPIIEQVKTRALSFSDDLRAALDAKGKRIDELRVRVIGFRDFRYDAAPIMASDFFDLPEQNEQFRAFVTGLAPLGGGDEPESGLEALALAITSPWATGASRNRQLIAVWTDASAHPLEEGAAVDRADYPQGLPRDLDALTDLWEAGDHVRNSAKRLIIFAPDAAGWSEVATSWSNTIHLVSEAGMGMAEQDYATILNSIANSV
jgi:hypothetical protein